MLTKDQTKLIHMAAHDAGLDDAEYREVWFTLAQVRSSKDPSLGQRHFDKFMGYVEAIYWRLPVGSRRASRVFQRPGYWAEKNTPQETSRDRYNLRQVQDQCRDLERDLLALGLSHAYCNAIARRLMPAGEASQLGDWLNYRAALTRTLKSKQQKLETAGVECPF